MRLAERISGSALPSLQDIYLKRCKSTGCFPVALLSSELAPLRTVLFMCFFYLFFTFLLLFLIRVSSAMIMYDRRTLLDIGQRYTNLIKDTLSTDPAWPLEILRSTELNNDHLNNRRRRKKHRGCHDLGLPLFLSLTHSVVHALTHTHAHVDRCFELRRRVRGAVSRPLEALTPAVVSSPLCSDPEPMQRGGVHISAEERERRIRSRLCLYCGAKGHFAASCPLKGQSSPVDGGVLASATVISSLPRSRTTISVVLRWAGITVNGLALIDSGAEGSFIDERWAMEQGIPLLDLNDTTTVFALDGRALSTVRRSTCPLSLTVSGNHRETISFFVFQSPYTPIVLGHPWLTQHNPQIDWVKGSVHSWNLSCHVNCLVSAVPAVSSVSVFQEEPGDLFGVPEDYHDLRAVFSRSRATSLPPHRPYDCSIELLPGTMPPRGRLYSLSAPERGALENYLTESLAAGIIVPSSSPAGAGFFFVKKKDGSLRPCIDYRGLNDITVKNRYPLPLMSSAFEILQGAKVFTKLDLRNAYHLVRIKEGDEWKTAFNTPIGHFEYRVLPFGLVNAPAVFQALVNDVLRDMLNIFVFVYLDDILIFSPTLQVHVQHVRRVLQRLLENRLFVKAEKCMFHAQSVTFLGSVVSAEGISMDPDKVRAVIVLPLRLPLSPLLRLAFLGPGLLRMRSSGLRGCLPPLPSSSLLIPRGSL